MHGGPSAELTFVFGTTSYRTNGFSVHWEIFLTVVVQNNRLPSKQLAVHIKTVSLNYPPPLSESYIMLLIDHTSPKCLFFKRFSCWTCLLIHSILHFSVFLPEMLASVTVSWGAGDSA